MSRSSGFVSPLGALAALAAATATFLVVCVPMSALWFGGVAGG